LKHSIVVPLAAGGFAVAFLSAVPIAADVCTLTSLAILDNGTLAMKDACGDKERSPNCVGGNISPSLAWSNPPEGAKRFSPCCSRSSK
jgi:phosphatidylethanolamine-binding protein (PEBP) family uncharacterized protein